MLEKAKNMTYAELPHTYDAWKHLSNGFLADYADDVEIFHGLGIGRRQDAVMARVYDAEIAELLCDHMAEKAKHRRQRKDARKHKELPEQRKHREEMRKDRMYGYYDNENCPKVMFAPDSKPIKHRRYAEEDRILRDDWELDLRDLEYDISYTERDIENCEEDIIHFTQTINRLDQEYNDVYEKLERIEENIKNLIECSQITEECLRNSKEFLQKYAYVKEMIK